MESIRYAFSMPYAMCSAYSSFLAFTSANGGAHRSRHAFQIM